MESTNLIVLPSDIICVQHIKRVQCTGGCSLYGSIFDNIDTLECIQYTRGVSRIHGPYHDECKKGGCQAIYLFWKPPCTGYPNALTTELCTAEYLQRDHDVPQCPQAFRYPSGAINTVWCNAVSLVY